MVPEGGRHACCLDHRQGALRRPPALLHLERSVKCEYRSGNRNCSLYSGIFALYPTCKVSPRGRPETRKLGILILGVPPRSDPRGAPGNSETRNLEFGLPPGRTREGPPETRKLGIWNLGVPLAWTCKRRPRKLGNSESGIWGSLGLGPKRGPRKLGNSESGICGTVSWNLHTRILGIWKWRRSILESAHMESRFSESGSLGIAWSQPRTHRGALETRKLGNWNLRRSIL